MDQSIRDAGARKTPVVAHTRNRSGWLVTMRADDWLTLIRQSDHVAAPVASDVAPDVAEARSDFDSATAKRPVPVSLPFAATSTPKPSP